MTSGLAVSAIRQVPSSSKVLFLTLDNPLYRSFTPYELSWAELVIVMLASNILMEDAA